LADWAFAARALRSRNYRLFFTGQSISLVGTWMTRVATSWLIYRLTGSAAMLGVASFAAQVPSFLLTPVAGVWVDRWNRHHTIVATQVLSMLQSLSLAALVFSGVREVWPVIALAVVQGVVNAFEVPARQSFVVQMVEHRADLASAIALNSSMINAGRLIGPAIAGVVVAAWGEAWCFLADGISYIAVIGSLLAMTLTPNPVPPRGTQVRDDLLEGWRYVGESVPIRSILSLLALTSLVGVPYSVLMPILATRLGGGPQTLGWLMAAHGVGALAGALLLATRRSVIGLGKRIGVATALFGGALAAFALSPWLWLSLILLPLAGFGMMQQMAASNTIVQTIVDDEKRGRVMSFYSMAFQGMVPFGGLLGGILAGHVGAPATVLAGGLACLAGSVWFGRRLPSVRKALKPVYRELGILPEIPD
jgi:MFS family permease